MPCDGKETECSNNKTGESFSAEIAGESGTASTRTGKNNSTEIKKCRKIIQIKISKIGKNTDLTLHYCMIFKNHAHYQ